MRNSIRSFFSHGPLVSERIADTGGRASGFDYLRFILAASIICFHSVVTSYGVQAQSAVNASPLGSVFRPLLPMFFALSGFLVAGSLERAPNLVVFLGLRVFRIFPALIVDTAVSALLIGTLFTQLPLPEYFSDVRFNEYFLNILGWIHY